MDVLAMIGFALLGMALLFVVVVALSFVACWGFELDWSLKIACGVWAVAMIACIAVKL